MRIIQLTQDKFALIDSKDFPIISSYKWCFDGRYATTHIKGKKNYLHRLLLNVPKGMFSDHINGNKLDNRRCNLRLCTPSQNSMNIPLTAKNTSGYKGVYFEKERNKWRAQIKFKDKRVRIGRYLTALEAAKTYNQYAKKYFGEFARLNYV